MNKIATFLLLFSLITIAGCQHIEYSYLDAKALSYPNNTMKVVVGLTDADTLISSVSGFPPRMQYIYKTRIKNRAPWLSQPFWSANVEGARPLTIKVAEVKTTGENADANKLLSELKIFGEGILELPFDTKVPVGEYLLSYDISNIAGTERVNDCFTIIVTDKK